MPPAHEQSFELCIPLARHDGDDEGSQDGSTVERILKDAGQIGDKQYYEVLCIDQSVTVVQVDKLADWANGGSAFADFDPLESRFSISSPSTSSGLSSPPVSEEPLGPLPRRRSSIRWAESDEENDSSGGDSSVSSSSEPIQQSRRSARQREVKSTLQQPAYINTFSAVPDEVSSQPQAEDDKSDSTENDYQIEFQSHHSSRRKRRKLSNNHQTQLHRLLITPDGVRRSGRARQTVLDIDTQRDAILLEDSRSNTKAMPRVSGLKENYISLPRDHEFRKVHYPYCDSCLEEDGKSLGNPLVFCQGCSVSYHKGCLGPRSAREHLVTKIGEDDCVLQCRRCVDTARKKDATAPAADMCQTCQEKGTSCTPFRQKKTPKQEEKERQENNNEDPVTTVDLALINNSERILFRCAYCRRGFHFHHLPDKQAASGMELEGSDLFNHRLAQYTSDWKCQECILAPGKMQSLLAWRPHIFANYTEGTTAEGVNEDEKEYLIKWQKKSYFRVTWMPGAWVWGTSHASMRKAFARRREGLNLPQMTAEEVVPEDFLRIDIVLDVIFNGEVAKSTEQVDKARIVEVDKALVKYKGLGYEDVVWEVPPDPEAGERRKDFEVAYQDFVMGRYVHLPKQYLLKERLEKLRSTDFESGVMKQAQPASLTGGEIMSYQLEGLNWLLYKFATQSNAILADEMGLGKTIQIIAFLATLVQDHRCWPFLVVVPNSTCPNWRREIKQWAPSLRVVAYYGSSEARKLAMEHELFPNGGKDLACHVVVTSYEAPVDDHSKKVFKSIPWAGMIVDEGQRLKNDQSLLYKALGQLNVSSKVLLTGTPLQNNARELFNLLQFLNSSYSAEDLEERYQDLTPEKLAELHGLIRPFFLRRTKAQVLNFLPPLAQIIVPVTMSVVQKKLSKSILAKNPQLIKAIFGKTDQQMKGGDRSNLNNLLMQLRKCLCHPFIYNRAIEEKEVSAEASYRQLVDASSKLQLLEIMLPKLKERGHRVLIFSQFLDMLDIIEEFLDGLDLEYERLDGSVGSLQKQKRIDAFNVPDSPLFAFLLSTRAGGVGINLATADTVIIMDPDFNPHQDIQALSRAHRIGQKKKVLVFQLMTRDSPEEKIMAIGKKKMALDHVLIERMDAKEDETVDLESVLRYGASKLFDDEDEAGAADTKYDFAAVEGLLDRSKVENTQLGTDNSAESQFSFARVWVKDKQGFEDALANAETEQEVPDASLWEKILKERERAAAKERAANEQTLGRGKRTKHMIDYAQTRYAGTGSGAGAGAGAGDEADLGSSSDEEFEERGDEGGVDMDDDDEPEPESVNPAELENRERLQGPRGLTSPGWTGHQPTRKHKYSSPLREPRASPSKRSKYLVPTTSSGLFPSHPSAAPKEKAQGKAKSAQVNISSPATPAGCSGCSIRHPAYLCPERLRKPAQSCPLCGLAHSAGPVCPHLQSETQVSLMLRALQSSQEDPEIVNAARTYLKNKKQTLGVQRRARQRAENKDRRVSVEANGEW